MNLFGYEEIKLPIASEFLKLLLRDQSPCEAA
jgi:hypothetical protein